MLAKRVDKPVRKAGCRVVVDGAPQEADRAQVLKDVDVLRADAHEAQIMAGSELKTTDDAAAFGRSLLRQGPDFVALGVEGRGKVIIWHGDDLAFPLVGPPAVDTTGAGGELRRHRYRGVDHTHRRPLLTRSLEDTSSCGAVRRPASSLAPHDAVKPGLFESVGPRGGVCPCSGW